MQECQHVDERAKRRIRTSAQRVFGDLAPSAAEIQLEPVGRLCHDLERLLQDAEGERVCRVGSQPQPEVLVWLLEKLFQDLFQRLEPLGQEVTVLQEDPEASVRSCLQEVGCDRTLPLAQRDVLQLGRCHAFSLGQLENAVCWIGSWRQDEDNGSLGAGLRQNLFVVEHRRLDIPLAKVLDDKLLNAVLYSVWTETFHNAALLEPVEVLLVRHGYAVILRVFQVVPHLPGLLVLRDKIDQVGELGSQSCQLKKILPSLR
mmetsp:Transcript_30797/g.69453  ORF Transcript_30797/g.69453 Transcript_30797/m.69453 type:complete len:259 (+) Transcript_30797:1391-2167(+)